MIQLESSVPAANAALFQHRSGKRERLLVSKFEMLPFVARIM